MHMHNIEHSEIYKGRRIEIIQDPDPLNPRAENENACNMVCHHGRYTLGDKHDHGADPLISINSVVEELTGSNPDRDNLSDAFSDLDDAPCFYRSLYLYDHSGITIATSPFSCPWDSGQVGFIYISYENCKKVFNWNDFGPTSEQMDKVYKLLEAEVKEYDSYLTGQCYGYMVFDTPTCGEDDSDELDDIDSCWGFLGDIQYAIDAAKEAIDALP